MLKQTAYASLTLQVIIGIITAAGLKIKIPEEKKIYKDMLKMELLVQIVELIFYTWMIKNLENISNITQYRYYDWLVTTPTMLITLMAYLDVKNYDSLFDFINKNKKNVILVTFLNLLMLLAGLGGELGYYEYNKIISIGFLPFIIYFWIIWKKYYVPNPNKNKRRLFLGFSILWTLYGVAAYLPYEQKNSSLNILDLFSKNLFGLFLVYNLWIKKNDKKLDV